MKILRLMTLASGPFLALTMTLTGCGHYPTYLKTRGDVSRASKNENHVVILSLPAKDVPALAKFSRLYELDFEEGATDEHLRALAQIRFTNLTEVVLTGCPLVTDKGVEHLSQIQSIKGLGLRGTSITDVACETVAKKIKLQGINVQNSHNVTINGLLKLAQSETIEELSFSLDNLTQGDLLQLINTSTRVNHIEIDIINFADKKLDATELRKAAKARNIKLLAVRDRYASDL